MISAVSPAVIVPRMIKLIDEGYGKEYSTPQLLLAGALIGNVLVLFFKKIHMRDSVKFLIILSFSFLLLELQNCLKGIIPISGLLAIMRLGIIIKNVIPS